MWAQNLFCGVSVFSKTILFRWYEWVHNWCDQGCTQKFLKGWGFNFLKSNQIQFKLIYCNHYSNQNVRYSQTGFSGNSWILLHLFFQKPCNNNFENCWLSRLCARECKLPQCGHLLVLHFEVWRKQKDPTFSKVTMLFCWSV